MEKYFAKYDSLAAFEADKNNLPANCIIMVGTDVGIKPADCKSATFDWSSGGISQGGDNEELL